MQDIPRKWVLVDRRGRCTLPKYLLKALGVDFGGTGNVSLLVEAQPDLNNTKYLTIKKGRS